METLFGIVVIFLIASVLLWSVVQVLPMLPHIFGKSKTDKTEKSPDSEPEKTKKRIGF